MALAYKMDAKPFKVFTLLGDGELSEGSVWEACTTASKYRLNNLVVIIDRNNLQISGDTELINPIEPLDKKFEAFGFSVKKINGHDIASLKENFNANTMDFLLLLDDFKNSYYNTESAVVAAITTDREEGQVLVVGVDGTKTITISTCTEKDACTTSTITNTVEIE